LAHQDSHHETPQMCRRATKKPVDSYRADHKPYLPWKCSTTELRGRTVRNLNLRYNSSPHLGPLPYHDLFPNSCSTTELRGQIVRNLSGESVPPAERSLRSGLGGVRDRVKPPTAGEELPPPAEWSLRSGVGEERIAERSQRNGPNLLPWGLNPRLLSEDSAIGPFDARDSACLDDHVPSGRSGL